MVGLLDSGLNGLSSSPGLGLCVVFLGKTRPSHSASLHLDVKMVTNKLYASGNNLLVGME